MGSWGTGRYHHAGHPCNCHPQAPNSAIQDAKLQRPTKLFRARFISRRGSLEGSTCLENVIVCDVDGCLFSGMADNEQTIGILGRFGSSQGSAALETSRNSFECSDARRITKLAAMDAARIECSEI